MKMDLHKMEISYLHEYVGKVLLPKLLQTGKGK